MTTTGEMRQRCASCGWPVAEAVLLSSHDTSQGVLRYRQCTCGRLLVELSGIEIGGTRDLHGFPGIDPTETEEIDVHLQMKDLPIVDDYGDGFCSRLVEWGGMIVSYETFPKGVDATPLFKGLPDDMCQSPHWGYILRGRMRIKRVGGDFVLRTGDVYYLEPGHVPVFEEATEVLEFSPKHEYQQTIDVVNHNIASQA